MAGQSGRKAGDRVVMEAPYEHMRLGRVLILNGTPGRVEPASAGGAIDVKFDARLVKVDPLAERQRHVRLGRFDACEGDAIIATRNDFNLGIFTGEVGQLREILPDGDFFVEFGGVGHKITSGAATGSAGLSLSTVASVPAHWLKDA